MPDLARPVAGPGQAGNVAALRAANFTVDADGNNVYDLGETVDTSDFRLEELNIGAHGSEVIPEPTSFVLVVLAALCGAGVRRKRVA